MEGQPAKRRRVYSLEPNKLVQAVFTRNYVNHLVPALMKIKERSSEEHKSHCEIQDVVKYEVDMAMAFSAQGFAWSNALKVKLQRDRGNVESGTSFVENEGGAGSSRTNNCDQNEMTPPLDFSSNPSSKSQAKILVSKYKVLPGMKSNLAEEENEDEIINSQLRSLRRLIPGGEELCNEKMVAELEGYISCLQMQVNILQYLAETR